MTLYQVIEIVNEEPLKIGAGGSKANQTEPSKDYVPGSTIRGAIIGEWVRRGLFQDYQRLILQSLECYNAYPYSHERLHTPTPRHLRVNKHELRKYMAHASEETNVPLTNLLESDQWGPDGGKNHLTYRFVAARGDRLFGKQVNREYRMHHSTVHKPHEKERDNLFRYQAISPGHQFRAILRFDDSLAPLFELFRQQPSLQLYLGGAKGSGYGLCRLTILGEATTSYETAKQRLGLHFERDYTNRKRLVITCLSDCLCRNEFGQPVNHIPEEVLSERCGHPVRLIDQYIEAGLTEGYNATWRARYPKETAIKAGSVLIYECQNELTHDEIETVIANLESQPIGHRTQEGFGWLGVNWLYPDRLALKEFAPKTMGRQERFNVDKFFQDTASRLDRSQAQVLAVLADGFRPAKERWLSLLCLRDKEIIISDKLKNHHYVQLLNRLEPILKHLTDNRLPQQLLQTNDGVDRDYVQDNELCSIAMVNFNGILQYLINGSASDRLHQYAQLQLRSTKGNLFYWNIRHPERLFVAELLYTGLRIGHRRCINESSS